MFSISVRGGIIELFRSSTRSINGRWEGRARLNAVLLINAAKGQSPIKPLTIRVESGRLIISGSSVPCEWESTAAAHVLIPIGATLFDTLFAGEQHSDEDLERAGHIDAVRDERKKRIRTDQLTSRDKRAHRGPSSPEPAISGSDSVRFSSRQNPAESRDLLALNLDSWGRSLLPQTGWRWGESRANSSREADPC